MNGEEPRFKRRRMTILMLPDDLILNCLARVSRLYYPTLSLVSKKFRSVLASTELYQTRTHLGRTESCLYVCLRLYTDSKPLCWFTLCQGPTNSKKLLVPISSPNFPSALWSHPLVVGPNVVNKKASSTVMVMDCHSHAWCEAPRMRVAGASHSDCVLDGKIYVTGGCKNIDLTNWMEVFDTKTQTWEFLHIPSEEIFGGSEDKSIGYEWQFCGKMAVLCQEFDNNYKESKIWCAEIAIEKRQKREIWGMLEWFDNVYTTNEPYI